MATTAATPLAEALALLNDPSATIYTNAAMLPILNKVYKELQTKLAALGVNVNKEKTAVITVAAGTVALVDGGQLPANLLYPIEMKESGVGANIWTPMQEMEWEPDIPQAQYLNFWTWREDEIKFLGATTARDVLLKYVKTLGDITATNSPILILNSTQWLAQRAAAVAAMTLGANRTRAEALMADIVDIWNDFQSTVIKRKQNIPVRRRRTRYHRM